MATEHTNVIKMIKRILEVLGLKCVKEATIYSDGKYRKLDLVCRDSKGKEFALEIDSNCQTGDAQCIVNLQKLDNFRKKEEGAATCHVDLNKGTVHCNKIASN